MLQTETNEFVVSCEHLEFGYVPGVTILKNVNFALPSEALGIVFGKSGNGKSTLLRCLTGYLRPSGGIINWSNNLMTTYTIPNYETDNTNSVERQARQLMELWSTISKNKRNNYKGLLRKLLYTENNSSMLVFADSANALPQLTTEENLMLVLAPICPNTTVCDEMVSLLLEITNLTEVRYHSSQHLSTGQLRRLCLAQSLATNPRILLWDEPTSGLDTNAKYELLLFLQNIRSVVRLPGIIVTHDIETALLLADVIYLFRDGQIVKSRKVDIPKPRFPQQLDDQEYRILRLEMINFLNS